ncbi:MAG: ribosome biogenesis GTPase Der [Saprospiraceae bacterium]|nr:ribosome biogenesis GTPase Der [Saprospiraceae bacterium]
MGNIVAIVGRPNVGKSTFFNRMIGMRKAIIDDVSGVTRDRQYGVCDWNGKQFTIIDTGGFIGDSEDVFAAAIRSQVHIAIEEAAVVLFMVDTMTGITDLDMQVAQLLRKSPKEVLLVANKVDNHERMMEAQEFWSLGFEELHCVSSVSGSGTGDLLDIIVNKLPEDTVEEEDIPKFAIIGRPNAGKSSLVNALLGEERSIVTDIAGTTRDTINAKYNKFGKEFLLMDTAGLRKKKNVRENLEFYSVMRAIKAIESTDVCLLMIDATRGVEAQDLNIFRLAVTNNKGVVILVNKWDLIEGKETNTARDMELLIRERISPFSDVPILFISVLDKQRIYKAVDLALEVYENRKRKISTSKLNDFLKESMERYAPPTHRGKHISIKYMTQLPTPYPSFVLFSNYPKHIKESYKQYLENRFRDVFEFTGTPLKLFFRDKNKQG